MSRKLIAQNCVTDKGKLHSDTTCYTVPWYFLIRD
jgi:hypothetical protein